MPSAKQRGLPACRQPALRATRRSGRRAVGGEAVVGAAQAPGQKPHDGDGEIRHFAEQAVESRLVDNDQFGRLQRYRRGAARAFVDERHFAEQATRPDHFHGVAGAADLDLARPDEIGDLAVIALDEDHAAVLEIDGRGIGANDQIDIETGFAHLALRCAWARQTICHAGLNEISPAARPTSRQG